MYLKAKLKENGINYQPNGDLDYKEDLLHTNSSDEKLKTGEVVLENPQFNYSDSDKVITWTNQSKNYLR